MFASPKITRGVTLIELLVTLAVLSILLSLVVPSFRAVIADASLSATTNGLHHMLVQARTRSVMLARPVSICPNGANGNCGDIDEWGRGAILFDDRDDDRIKRADETLTSVWEGAASASVRIDANVEAITFYPDGSASGGAGQARWLVCDAKSQARPRQIRLTQIGYSFSTVLNTCE